MQCYKQYAVLHPVMGLKYICAPCIVISYIMTAEQNVLQLKNIPLHAANTSTHYPCGSDYFSSMSMKASLHSLI